MKKILFLSLLAGLFYACKKDSVGTKPILSFNSYSIDSVVPSTQQMVVTMNVEDGDGDIEDSLWIGPVFNSNGPNADTLYSIKRMGNIGANSGNKVKAEVQILLRSIEFKLVQNTGVDSIHFVVFIKDNAGHFSDTISTPKMPYNY